MNRLLSTPPVLPRSVREFLPHRPPMQLVDQLLTARDGNGVVEANLAPGCPVLNETGDLEMVGLIELIAQSYAAVQGFDDYCAGRPGGMGFLVGIRNARLLGSARAGQRLLIEVRTVARINAFAMVEGDVRSGATLLASAALKLWLPGGAE